MNGGPVSEADLQAYVDGRLTPEREREVAEWLVERPKQAERITAYRAQSLALRSALASVADEPLPASLDLRLRHSPGATPFPARQAGIAAAAALLLVLGGAGGWLLRDITSPPTTGTAMLAREATANYMVYASDSTRPVELGADHRRALDDWFSNRLSRPISSPDLEPVGLKLIGGRLVATEHGPAGLYLYADGHGRRVALYVRPMKIDKNDRMVRRQGEGVHGWTWADNGLGFGIFGLEQAETLHRAADMTRRHYLAA